MIIGCSIEISLTVNWPMFRQHSTFHKSINVILDQPTVELSIDVNRDGSVVGRTWKGWFELLLIPSLILHPNYLSTDDSGFCKFDSRC